MKIAILSTSKHIHSTNRLYETITSRKHECEVINHVRCYVVMEKGKSVVYNDGKPITGIDAVIPRIGASVTFYGAAIVRQFEMLDVFTTVKSIALARSRDKLRSLQLLSKAGIGMPITAFADNPSDIDDLIQKVGGPPLIIKLLEGTHGVGVVLAETKKAAKSVLEAFYGLKATMLVQEYIKESAGTDIRAFVVGGKVVAAMRRRGAEGDFRANLHRGGSAEAITLTKEEEQTAIDAVNTLGLYIAGVDMLPSSRGMLVTEVNPSPGLEGIEKVTKVDVASKIVEFVEQNAQDKKKKDIIGA